MGGARLNSITDAPLCHVTDRAVKCFGKSDGIPISPVDALLADGEGGFWLGGHTALVHWHAGVSETYPVEGLKANVGNRDNKPGVWARWNCLGWYSRRRTRARTRKVEQGAVGPFVTPTFDGRKFGSSTCSSTVMATFGWAPPGKGLLRINGNVVDRYGRAEGLSGDSVGSL